MSLYLSRRNLLALAGAGALSAGTLKSVVAHSQAGQTSPYAFPGGAELSWVSPWELNEENLAVSFLPNSASLQGGNLGEVVVGFYDSPTPIDDAAKAILTFLVQDPALAPNVGGGGSGGSNQRSTDYRVHSMTVGDVAYGVYIELVGGQDLTLLAAPVADFATELASAQSSVMLDGVGVLGGADGVSIQEQLEAAAPSANAEVGEYTDGSGFLTVTWTNGWTEIERDDVGIRLTNPAQSIILYPQIVALEGMSWQEAADSDVAYLLDDQGANATISGPEVTESGYSFATDGEYGLRLAQATSSDSPDMYVFVFAANIEVKGADAVALLEEAQAAVTVNGNPPLTGLDAFIDVA